MTVHEMTLLQTRAGQKVSVSKKYPDTFAFAVSKSVSEYIFIKLKSIRIWIHLESICMVMHGLG